ncbi:hypothetical protein HO133_008844 [Letharia lupina]|uniref:SCP domain-containing protein n=1 Tax=Letharia lupina TaxID=560253 RepID=A0A8H6CPD5_9LECA|nr:uncharacterized protein HO133_008844 [Letharia lupina]KAF6227400.1 hypothetical protein HO133_008844 [Letharia lupina]
MHLPPLPIILIPLLSTLTAAVLVVETSTSTYTAAAATSSSPSPSSSPSSPTSSTPSASAQYTSDSTFESSILNSTNTYRANYNATALAWNASLATYATAWASKCHFNHSHGAAGENLAEGYANVTDAVDAWGREGSRYDFRNGGGFSESTGHFSQLVWKGTTGGWEGGGEVGGGGGGEGGGGRVSGLFGGEDEWRGEEGGFVGGVVDCGGRDVDGFVVVKDAPGAWEVGFMPHECV